MPVFQVEFECLNCGHQWTDGFNEKELVRHNSMSKKKRVSIYKTSEFGTPEHKGNVGCPVCETYEKIRTIDRSPV